MSNKWRKLDINNLPSDIFSPIAKWEFHWNSNGAFAIFVISSKLLSVDVAGSFFRDYFKDKDPLFYRRPKGWEPEECPSCGSDDKAVRPFVAPPGMPHAGQECPDPWHDEPKPPTHEEIAPFDGMLHFFPEMRNGNMLGILKKFNAKTGEWEEQKQPVFCPTTSAPLTGTVGAYGAFTGRQSADIPPEASS